MSKKIGFSLLWLGFIIYAFGFAPPQQPDTFELVKNLSTGNWAGINPLIVSLFNLMGVWPAIYACVLFFDGRNQKIPAWPFVTASLGVGAFAILPYLALRQPNPGFTGNRNLFLKLLDSRWIGIILTFVTVVLLVGGILTGDWSDYVQQWQTSRFIHVMSLDFCLLCLLFPALLRDDMARRGLSTSRLFWAVALVPLLGPLIYLCWRPSLADSDKAISAQGSAVPQ